MAPTRRPTTTSRRSSCWPIRAARGEVDVEVSKLVVNAAEALTASGHPIRAAALLKEQLDLLPADADPSGRARLLSARANCLILIETDEDRIEVSAEAVALVPDEDDRAARQGAGHPRPDARVDGAVTRRRRWSASTPSSSPSGSTSTSSPPTRSPRSASSRRPAPRRACARRWSTRSPGPQQSGALEGRAARPLPARPLLPGLGGVRRDREVVHQRHRARRGGGIPWAPYAFESRWQLALVAARPAVSGTARSS